MTEQEQPLPGPLLDIPTAAPHLLEVLPGKYSIQFDPAEYLVLRLGQRLGCHAAGAAFQHPAVMARRHEVFHFKHYTDQGGKFWTRSLGVSYYFVLPKSAIKIVPEFGGSWPKTAIGGKLVTLNVSGGTSDKYGWIDWVNWLTETSVDLPVTTLKTVAGLAWPLEACQAAGITLDFPPMSDGDRADLEAGLAEKAGRKALKEGFQLQLARGFSFSGETQLVVQQPPHRHAQAVYCRRPNAPVATYNRVRVTFRQIDWPETCRLNSIDATQLGDAFNLLAPKPLDPQAEDLFAAAFALTGAQSTLAEAVAQNLLPAPVAA